jgi:hypothetical protein
VLGSAHLTRKRPLGPAEMRSPIRASQVSTAELSQKREPRVPENFSARPTREIPSPPQPDPPIIPSRLLLSPAAPPELETATSLQIPAAGDLQLGSSNRIRLPAASSSRARPLVARDRDQTAAFSRRPAATAASSRRSAAGARDRRLLASTCSTSSRPPPPPVDLQHAAASTSAVDPQQATNTRSRPPMTGPAA